MASVALGQVTRRRRGRGCEGPAEARGEKEARAGVSGEVCWARGIVETYDTTKKPLVYEQRVALGSVGGTGEASGAAVSFGRE